ncbi:MAG: hypothetical protein AB8C46_02670 [Burkholderiaceae bacterium]
MFSFRASQVTVPLSLGAFALVVAFANGTVFASPAEAAKKKVVDTTTSIFRCTLDGGATEYSDRRCKDAIRVNRWKSERIAPGITAGAQGGVDLHDDQAPIMHQRDDPYVTCKKLGGTYYVAAKLCKMPPEAKIRIYIP